MNRENLFILFLFASLLLESTLISFPFVFLLSLVFYILYPSEKIIIISVIAGLLGDILNVAILGQTPLVLLISYLFIGLYKRAFDIPKLWLK